MSSRLHVRLYRRSLKLALDWSVHRYLWRGQALYLRGLFEANKHVTEPRQQRVRPLQAAHARHESCNMDKPG
jgi:NADH dehydrogenase (ubiquinone) 1 beta subcomplex subunit 9